MLPKFADHPVLHQTYPYFFLSPKQGNQIYKNYLSIVFKIDLHTANEIYTTLKELLIAETKKKFNISMLPGCLFSQYSPHQSFNYRFEKVAQAISNLCVNDTRGEGKFDEEKFFAIGLILTAHIAKSIDIAYAELTKCNYYSSLKYFLTTKEQTRVKDLSALKLLKKKKYKLLEKQYLLHKDPYHRLIEKGQSLNNKDLVQAGLKYADVLLALDAFLEKEFTVPTCLKTNEITLNILKTKFGINETEKALLYILTFDQIVRALHINNGYKCLILYALSEFKG